MRQAIILNSNRHVHLSRECLDTLYGKGYELTVKTKLGHPIFAAQETVTLTGPKGSIHNVRILGPLRSYVQAEILRADRWVLGIDAPVLISGSQDSAAFTISGPQGAVQCSHGMLVAMRHLHLSEQDAMAWGVQHGQIVQVKVGGERALVFDKVMVVYTDIDRPTVHVDIEEGNAACINNMDIVDILY